ncbi:hypothetical protein B7494_g323 [Chlorociboria aeruginascens]|nr:hypothetical protein B7494_g323 [Chlorociboria aeruginascens]
MRGLLFIFVQDPIGSRGNIVAEERDVDCAVDEQLLAGRLLTRGELWSCYLLLDLDSIGFLARSRNRLAEFDAQVRIFLGVLRQSCVDCLYRLLSRVDCVGDCEVNQSRRFGALESHRQVLVVQSRWRVIPVEEFEVTAISEDDQLVARWLAIVVASRGDGEVVGDPAG